MPPLIKLSRDFLVIDVQLTRQQVINDLLTIKVGQQTSRITRLNIITARRFLASKNQFQLVILEFGCLGHRMASFGSIQHYTYVGQIKVNHNWVMCQMSVKLPAMFDQNPPHTLD